LPERYFFSENGGEFVNKLVTNYLQQAGIELKTTGSFSPQQNGVNERNHGAADIMISKFRAENLKMSLQEAVNWAAFARNCQVSATRGFSTFQLVFGRNPGIAGLSECTTGSLETFTPNEISRQMISKMERARDLINDAESDMRLKIAMKDRLPRELNRNIDIGDSVTFRDHKDKVFRNGKVTGQDGGISLIKWCNHEGRVPTREMMPSKEQRDKEEKESRKEEGNTDIETNEEIICRTRKSRWRKGPNEKKKGGNNGMPNSSQNRKGNKGPTAGRRCAVGRVRSYTKNEADRYV